MSPGHHEAFFTPTCELPSFIVFAFDGQIDLTAVPFCMNDAARALQTERPRPYFLCDECMHGIVHTLARCKMIAGVCPQCADGTCGQTDPTNEYTTPEWNRDPEGTDMRLDENGDPVDE